MPIAEKLFLYFFNFLIILIIGAILEVMAKRSMGEERYTNLIKQIKELKNGRMFGIILTIIGVLTCLIGFLFSENNSIYRNVNPPPFLWELRDSVIEVKAPNILNLFHRLGHETPSLTPEQKTWAENYLKLADTPELKQRALKFLQSKGVSEADLTISMGTQQYLIDVTIPLKFVLIIGFVMISLGIIFLNINRSPKT